MSNVTIKPNAKLTMSNTKMASTSFSTIGIHMSVRSSPMHYSFHLSICID
jgi:hypothetical protein